MIQEGPGTESGGLNENAPDGSQIWVFGLQLVELDGHD